MSGTPRRQSAASASRFSTPLQHDAVSRLRGSRASYTPPSQASSSSSHGSDAYVTPRSSRTSYPVAGSDMPGPPRTPIQGTPSRRKGAVRIVKAPSKPWYERRVSLFTLTLRPILTASADSQDCPSKYGTDTSCN